MNIFKLELRSLGYKELSYSELIGSDCTKYTL